LIELFEELGAKVRYSDPHVPHPPKMREHDLRHHSSLTITPQSLETFDAVVVATDHAAFDWNLIAEHARLVIDTRNALASRLAGKAHYFKA
jgi:UDP-N-acetyl-D-glucosamine dehydrogenase